MSGIGGGVEVVVGIAGVTLPRPLGRARAWLQKIGFKPLVEPLLDLGHRSGYDVGLSSAQEALCR